MNTHTVTSNASRAKRHSLSLLLALATIALLVAEAACRFGALSIVENTYTDLWHRWSGVRYAPQHTAFVVVDVTPHCALPRRPAGALAAAVRARGGYRARSRRDGDRP